ncbi:TonB-dependent receptor [Umboniibacter marinipuniceus]|uniref:Outer membrane receptor protein involved in Fe transport n=1 Tax=Umboniibacter marinipuniceus TaxID=569599 RepID=A0A3M0AM08_9GAMM|nr:TonB-dependent receptor [Umboniibacter marinipuniceus]RMA80012.1 outer membrane receptor protein involved in Fe transport [Umboniibacter marinipuniceus]
MIKSSKPTTRISALAAAICLANVAHSAVLEEVLVTAQKREQSLQEVPVAVTAISGEALQESVIKDVFDLQTNVPGLIAGINQTANTANFSIRGVGTSSQNYGLESSVGLYVDGVYRARQSSMINEMVDLEAVEVLKGPQGTLFGKNTPSGAILFRSAKPTHDGDGYINVNVGNYGLTNVQLAKSISAIDDELAFRITGFSSERDGFGEIVNLDQDINNRNRWGLRFQALWEPSDELSVRFIADHAELNEICCVAPTKLNSFYTTANGAPEFGTDALFQSLGGTVLNDDDYYNRQMSSNIVPTSTVVDSGYSLEVNYDLNDSLTLTSVTALRSFDSGDEIDSDFSDVRIITTINDAESDSFSQELRLTFQGDNLTAVGGLYYYQQEVDLHYELNGYDQLEPYAVTALGLDAFIGGIDTIAAQLAGTPFAPLFPGAAKPFFDEYSAQHDAMQDQNSYAVFGQMDYSFTDSLILTAGVRFTSEEKDLNTKYYELDGGQEVTWGPATSLAQIGAAGADLPALGYALATGDTATALQLMPQYQPYFSQGWANYALAVLAPRPDITANLSDEQITGSVKLAFLPDDNTLMYASVGTGYKSGGTNTDRIDAAFDPVFDAETSITYELGFKRDFDSIGMRVNAALFASTVDDFQANAFTGTGFNLQNAGQLETSGGELEVLWAVTDLLTANLGYAYTDASFKDFKQGNCWVATPWQTGMADPGDSGQGFCDRSGDRLSNVPEHDAVFGLNQGFNLSSGVEGFVQAEYVYRSDTMTDGNNDPLKAQDAYSSINARAGISFIDADVDVIFWGRNITDEEFHATVFDVPLQDGKLKAYPGEPATFGVSIQKNF